MEQFPIRTFTIVNAAEQSVLHSPALPRLGVPYADVTDCAATKMVVTTFEGAEREATLRDGALRITLPAAEFAALERVLMAARREPGGVRFPFSVITEPPMVRFATDNERVVELVLPC